MQFLSIIAILFEKKKKLKRSKIQRDAYIPMRFEVRNGK